MPVKIVIYEDNHFLRDSLCMFLNSSERYVVHMEKLRPDIVLMDIGMSGTNGLEGLNLIKANYPDILVMMLTVFEDNDYIFEAICRGASAYLLKNTAIDKIPDAIEDMLSGGSPMTPSVARKVLMLFKDLAIPRENQFGLSHRETEVLHLLTSGYSYKMIAHKCYISIDTVRSHIKKVYEKLQVHSATEAAAKLFSTKYKS
jgi:DNA-binding NarL/FixJ family response regulator